MAIYFLILGALIGGAAAQRKKFSIVLGVICGALLGPLAVFLYLVKGDLKECPHCAEKIKIKAKICPHCQNSTEKSITSMVTPKSPLPVESSSTTSEKKNPRPPQGVQDYLAATQLVLAGCSLTQQQVIAISVAVETQKTGQLLAIVEEKDFLWPWFDKCLATFKEKDIWPDLAAWSWFEEEPDTAQGADEVLSKIPKTSLLNIAKRHEISMPSTAKVGDIRKLLAEKLSENQIATYAAAINKKLMQSHKDRCLSEKLNLLSSSIQSKLYNQNRHEQLAYMVTEMGCTVKVDYADEAAEEIGRGYVFQPSDQDRTPPFYPGDVSDLKSVSPKLKSVPA